MCVGGGYVREGAEEACEVDKVKRLIGACRRRARCRQSHGLGGERGRVGVRDGCGASAEGRMGLATGSGQGSPRSGCGSACSLSPHLNSPTLRPPFLFTISHTQVSGVRRASLRPDELCALYPSHTPPHLTSPRPLGPRSPACDLPA